MSSSNDVKWSFDNSNSSFGTKAVYTAPAGTTTTSLSTSSTTISDPSFSWTIDTSKVREGVIELETGGLRVIDGEEIFKEFGEESHLSDRRRERIKDWTVVCLKCGEMWLLKSTITDFRGDLPFMRCPECGNVKFGMSEKSSWRVTKEILRGKESREENENRSN